jgi:AcrR family transcriptional regulator
VDALNQLQPAPLHPRVQRTKAHVLSVARKMLAEVGPAELTYTALCATSGVTRQTLYRHWPTREALLAEIVLTAADVAYPRPGSDAGAVVTEYLHSLRSGMNDPSTAAALTSLAAHASTDPASDNALRTIVADRLAALNALLTGAGREVDPSQFAQLAGPVIFQRLIARVEPTDSFIQTLVANWLAVPSAK